MTRSMDGVNLQGNEKTQMSWGMEWLLSQTVTPTVSLEVGRQRGHQCVREWERVRETNSDRGGGGQRAEVSGCALRTGAR